jgi:dynein heavy chain 1
LSQGFAYAESLAAKVVKVFESCVDELSYQKHYDFGLRALKSVLSSAGVMRREFMLAQDESLSEGREEQIVADAFKGSVSPKLLKDDAEKLLEVLGRVFTASAENSSSDSKFADCLSKSCKSLHLFPAPDWVQKLFQIKELVRCGI